MRDPVLQRKLPTVLLIDDDLISREVAATVLTMSGYTVHTAADGEESLDMLAKGECRPDVILADAHMPGLSGTALLAKLRERSPAMLIAMSGSNASEEIGAAADGFLLKPFDGDDLQKLLQSREPAAPQSAAPTFEAGAPVVSAETLAHLRTMMPESAIREIYTAVVVDLGKRAKVLEAAIARGDSDEIRRIGHAIKGGCGMAGAREAARIGALLEASSADSDGNHLDHKFRLLRDLRAATRNLKRMLETELPAKSEE